MRKELSERAKQICKDHYSNCRCPINRECTSYVGPGQEALNNWIDRVNIATEGVSQ